MENLYGKPTNYNITSFTINFTEPENNPAATPPPAALKITQPESLKELAYSTGIFMLFSSALLLAVINSDKLFGYWDKFQNSLFPDPTPRGATGEPFIHKDPPLLTSDKCPMKIYPYIGPTGKRRFTLTGEEIPEGEMLDTCSRH